MNPYKVKLEELKTSEPITNHLDLIKLELISLFNNFTNKMDTKEIILKTGIHKSDLSRVRALDFERFSIDRLLTLLLKLDVKTKFKCSRIAK